MAGEWNGARQEPSDPDTPTPDALERQAREAMAQIRARVGDLGSRVRRVVERAGEHWEASAPAPSAGNPSVPISAGERARVLARRWADIDFLVDPELAAGIAVHSLEESALWRVELRERGETRLLEVRVAPYRGEQMPHHQDVRSVWDYTFPATPEIEAGTRRERVPGTGSVLACDACGGSGRRPCRSCDGAGNTLCARCRGTGRLSCLHCRGRGRLAKPRAGASPTQLRVERLAQDAGERVIDLQDRLAHAWGKSFRPTFEWTPTRTEADDTVPCPYCESGTTACDCDRGKRVCTNCNSTGVEECPRCKGSGRVIRYREVIRRFDTRIGTRTLPLDERASDWLLEETLARATGEQIWAGPLEEAQRESAAPSGVLDAVWNEAIAFTAQGIPDDTANMTSGGAGEGERRFISRRLALIRVPLVHLDYEFARHRYVVTAYGMEGQERFSAERFPHRWSRVGRFFRAISRDLGEPPATSPSGETRDSITTLEDYRARHTGDPTGD
jgi:hypothetical protein